MMKTCMKGIFLSLILVNCFMANAQDNHRANFYRIKHQEHKVLVQYYRWFQVFEVPQNKRRISNHMEILGDSVKITTSQGPIYGQQGMRNFLNFVKDWKNSHHIEHTDFKTNMDGTFTLEANILYQNVLPDGEWNNYRLHYTTQLEPAKNIGYLPIFTELQLLPTEISEPPVYKDAYSENRCKSFIYYWFTLLDDFNGNGEKFGELLSPNCDLRFFERKAINLQQFVDIMTDAFMDIRIGLHLPQNIQVKKKDDGLFSVSFDLEWFGLNHNGQELTGKVHHDWILVNNRNERFARMKKMSITMVEPFHIVKH